MQSPWASESSACQGSLPLVGHGCAAVVLEGLAPPLVVEERVECAAGGEDGVERSAPADPLGENDAPFPPPGPSDSPGPRRARCGRGVGGGVEAAPSLALGWTATRYGGGW